MEIYNGNKVLSITILDKVQWNWVQYFEYKKKTFWDSERKEGFYNVTSYSNSGPFTEEQLLSGIVEDYRLMVIDKQVYISPRVRIKFVNNDNKVLFFKTHDEAKKYGDEIADKCIDIKLTFE
jgi:hypothetical protein